MIRSRVVRPLVTRCVGPLRVAALVAAALPLFPGTSRAKGPEPDEMPTLEQIYQQAKSEREAAERAAELAARDPRKEAIEAYATGATDIAEYKPLTDVINDGKTDELQRYRQQAARAILMRFAQENQDDPAVRRVRSALALEIVDLMKANSSDTVGLAIVQDVLRAWWAQKLNSDIRFRAEDKWKDRSKAWRKMKAYLQSN